MTDMTNEELVVKLRTRGNAGGALCHEAASRISSLSKVVEAARAANLLDERGEVRRVLGVLPLTADGCVVGHMASVLFTLPNGEILCASTMHEEVVYNYAAHQTITQKFSRCYRTYEAAKAAALAKDAT